MAEDDFLASFCKNDDGSWTCRRASALRIARGSIEVTPGSTFYPGTTFMGFDLAGWLEHALDDRAERCGQQ